MSFTQPCFIRKNTPELRKKLEDIGHVRYPYEFADWDDDRPDRKYIVIDIMYYTYSTKPIGKPKKKDGDFVDCDDNEELFLALAALRDDTDKNQYWICDKVSFTIGKTYYPGDYIYYQYDEFFDKQNWHKATTKEIVKHFKTK